MLCPGCPPRSKANLRELVTQSCKWDPWTQLSSHLNGNSLCIGNRKTWTLFWKSTSPPEQARTASLAEERQPANGRSQVPVAHVTWSPFQNGPNMRPTQKKNSLPLSCLHQERSLGQRRRLESALKFQGSRSTWQMNQESESRQPKGDGRQSPFPELTACCNTRTPGPPPSHQTSLRNPQAQRVRSEPPTRGAAFQRPQAQRQRMAQGPEEAFGALHHRRRQRRLDVHLARGGSSLRKLTEPPKRCQVPKFQTKPAGLGFRPGSEGQVRT